MAKAKKAAKKSSHAKKSGPKKAVKKVLKNAVPKKAIKKAAPKKATPKRTEKVRGAAPHSPKWQAYCKTEGINIGSPTTDFNHADALATAHKVGTTDRHVVTVIASN